MNLHHLFRAAIGCWHSPPWQAAFYVEARGHSLRTRIGRLLEPVPRSEQRLRRWTLLGVVLAMLLAASVRVQPTALAEEETPRVDALTEQLFRQYVAVNGKIDSDDVQAAIELVASRGVENGYWRTVLAEFEKSCDDDNSIVRKNTLAVMSKMLAVDGSVRWIEQQARQERLAQQAAAAPRASGVQSIPASNLGPEVLERVIERAYEVRHLFDLVDYVVAARQAHDDRAAPFLEKVLHGGDRESEHWRQTSGGAWTEPQFHAAVALAELGRPEGVEWLIAHTDATGGSLFRMPHAETSEVYLACRLALEELTGAQVTPAPGDWQEQAWRAWWAAHQESFSPRQAVALRVP